MPGILPRALGTGILLFATSNVFAGFFEISANGSYMKYNNGLVGGETAFTTVTRWGAGLGYHLMAQTSIEINYSSSRTVDTFTQDATNEDRKYDIEKISDIQNVSLDLVLQLTERKSAFRPYIRGGAGVMLRKVKLSGRFTEKLTEISGPLSFTNIPTDQSLSANAGIGFKYMLTEALALDLSGTVFATDLDQSNKYFHYSYAGGFRIIF